MSAGEGMSEGDCGVRRGVSRNNCPHTGWGREQDPREGGYHNSARHRGDLGFLPHGHGLPALLFQLTQQQQGAASARRAAPGWWHCRDRSAAREHPGAFQTSPVAKPWKSRKIPCPAAVSLILGAEALPWASSRPEEQLQDHAWAMEGRRQCACCWRCLQSVGLGAPRHEMASNQAQCGCSVRNPELSIRDAQRLSLNCADKASLGPLVTPGPAVAVCVWVHLSWTEVPLLPPLFAGCLVDPLSPSNLWGFSHYG